MSNESYGGHPDQPGQPPYGAQPQYPGQPQYPAQPPYGAQPQYPGQPAPGQYPGYGGPAGYPQAPNPGVGGLAIAALIVSIVAFLSGWVPFVGLVLAIVGLVLGILALRKPRGKGLGITAIVLSALAALTGIIMLVVTFWFIPAAIESEIQQYDDSTELWAEEDESDLGESSFDEAEFSAVSGQFIETPCWSYDGPQYFTNNISSTDVDACVGKLELWGEYDEDDNFYPTGAGMIAGQIGVMPLNLDASNAYGPVGDLDAAVEGLQEPFFSQQGGEAIGEETVTLDGAEARLIRYESDAADTKTKAFLTVFSPEPYPIAGTQAQLFVISLVTPYSNGEDQLQQIIDSWEWK
ncbi:hypothetical protein [Microbacterium sp.]|uniref:DUF4190 domain-containing protein n=1 Tax=Microbacterium sp. TaxID=51671 RepID=UPI003A8ED31E